MRRSVAVLACSLLAVAAAPAGAVVGGKAAREGQFPEVAEITFGSGFLCSGTLIDPTHVLTAGHCGSATGGVLASPLSWPTALIDVRLGSNRAQRGTRFPVASVAIPPEYQGTTNRGDIAILTLARAAPYKPTPVAGPRERPIWKPGVRATIAGWGRMGAAGEVPDTLQWARVPITTDGYCASRYGEDDLEFDRETMVCAGYDKGGADTCEGDSGGPLFARTAKGARRVVGVTSWGAECGAARRPGVYARVSDTKLREWVASVAPRGVSRGKSRKPRSN